ncbi:MAG: hypothetical protein R2856_15520 [Caldilineaceae bacterium]
MRLGGAELSGKLAITEYNWSGLDHINGALTQADILGIFARRTRPGHALRHALRQRRFTPSGPTGYTFACTATTTATAQSSATSACAAATIRRNWRSTPLSAAWTAHTLLVINKTGESLTAALTISNLQSPASSAAVFRYSADNLSAIVPRRISRSATASYHRPSANSLTLFVLPQSDVPGFWIFLPTLIDEEKTEEN